MDSITSTLKNEGYPNSFSSLKLINIEYIRETLDIEPYFAEFVSSLVTQIRKFQKNIYSEKLVKMDKKNEKKMKRVKGIIGGHHDKLILFEKYFLKKLSSLHSLNEAYMYFVIHRDFPDLCPFLAKVFGIVFVPDDYTIQIEKLEDLILRDKSFEEELVYYYPFKEYF